ncbi:polysaccharide biosynthesis protein [Pseudidiomarina salinarum]|uniref:Polysaccharide biosynthesis protein n=2 Tax=Pseudidiomarina salinarum TaxID=435908 RepID=A0A094IZZ3_9GAMM|nr:SLBB domain-containing protein [Pseudidiomarina salinarum]KFZ31349.1 polysaccharide biosynthesis protein [Pseudidiomarina salinarum]RUO70892.1 polysaccharide biosynthesis protein [Pseudidiomarina salinarum]
MTSLLIFSESAQAQVAGITPQQLEQFKKLPRAQQEMLARQYGFDLSLLDGSGEAAGKGARNPQTVFPRGTTFDESGEPVIPDDIAAQFQEEDGDLQPFGYKLFAGEPSTFAQVTDAPVPTNYIIGVGDTIQVQLYGKESRSHQVVVSRQGQITIPDLGPLQVVGLTFEKMRELVQQEVSQRLIGMQAAVSMGELRSIQIFVMGEAYKPGAYTVSSLTTIMQALFVSGGVSDIASLRNIQLKRGGETIATLDLYDFLIHGNMANDRLLQSGDMVFIPSRSEMVTVDGEVVRPAIYELKNEKNLAEVLELAGGVLPTAYTKATRIERIRKGGRVINTVDLANAKSLTVDGGDNIEVPAVSNEIVDSVMLVGAVTRPGYYEFTEGMRVSDVLTDIKTSLLSYADLGYGLIVRERDQRREIEVHQFDVEAAITGESKHDKRLKAQDQLVIFSRYEDAKLQELQLTDWIVSETEQERRERTQLLKEYRQNYLRGLVAAQQERLDQEAQEQQSSETQQELRGLFTQRGVYDELGESKIQEYAEYSRHNMLEPILAKLRHQFTESGSLPIVHVEGEVNYPGVYPLVEGATASNLIAAAGGLKASAYLARAEITRTQLKSGETVTDYVSFNLFDVLMGETNVPIKSRDSLNVFVIPDWQNTLEVTLEGEVRFPGKYTIRRGETLAALIERAGGLTEYAFPRGAVFTREELKKLESQRMRSLARELQHEIATNIITGNNQSDMSYQQIRQLLQDLMAVDPVGRLIIDLPYILSGNLNADIQLKDGDKLVIPTQRSTVNVIGEVQLASSFLYDGSLSVDDYLRRAGGTRKKADEDRIFIVKANGAVEMVEVGGWFSLGTKNRIEPGDTVVVPLDTEYTNNIELWRDATQILYQIGVALAALTAI